MPTAFTQNEAQALVGRVVESVIDLPSVPKHTTGRVTEICPRPDGDWGVRVAWNLPDKVSHIDAMVFDVSLNLFSRRTPVTSEFDRAEYEAALR